MLANRLTCFKSYMKYTFLLAQAFSENNIFDLGIVENKYLENIYKQFSEKYSSDKFLIVQCTILTIINELCKSIEGSYIKEDVENFKLLLAGYFDEIVLHSNYTVNFKWGEYLVERKLFGSSVSGEEIIAQMEKFLLMHSNSDIELSKIYYYMLCTGFCGSLRIHSRSIASLKHKILTCMNSDYGIKNSDIIYHISSGPYEYTLRCNKKLKIINYKKLYLLISVCLVGFIFVLFCFICFCILHFSN